MHTHASAHRHRHIDACTNACKHAQTQTQESNNKLEDLQKWLFHTYNFNGMKSGKIPRVDQEKCCMCKS